MIMKELTALLFPSHVLRTGYGFINRRWPAVNFLGPSKQILNHYESPVESYHPSTQSMPHLHSTGSYYEVGSNSMPLRVTRRSASSVESLCREDSIGSVVDHIRRHRSKSRLMHRTWWKHKMGRLADRDWWKDKVGLVGTAALGSLVLVGGAVVGVLALLAGTVVLAVRVTVGLVGDVLMVLFLPCALVVPNIVWADTPRFDEGRVFLRES
ncbi:uncharacterized protein N7482_005502 [Penicillium canariense]|uniref:Uncharacterized protein n=1 Tax=Penicillium canariense TaxID=189055 RepID=A0A9W9LN26_9EURO|nr:uncharacterized protein N7482_005502 [Penicillium canariense]KAJ5166721.1 hypothetical protein N7482_005502 [Penicillium canariense]